MASTDPEKTLDGKCKGCGEVFTVARLPMPLDQIARLSMRAKCPTCGGKRIAVANLQND